MNKPDAFITATLCDEEYIISNTQIVATHANIDDSVTHWTLNLRDGEKRKYKEVKKMNMIENEYRFNSNFRKFVDEYCDKNRKTVEEAFNDAFIKQMFWKYTEV